MAKHQACCWPWHSLSFSMIEPRRHIPFDLARVFQLVMASVVSRDEDHEHSLLIDEVSLPSLGPSLTSFCYHSCSVLVNPSLSALSETEMRVSGATSILYL